MFLFVRKKVVERNGNTTADAFIQKLRESADNPGSSIKLPGNEWFYEICK